MEQFDHGSKTSPTERSRVWLACSIAVVAVTAAGIVLLGFRVANDGEEPAGLNWWFVTWFCVGLAYSAVGAALVARSSRRRLGAYFLIVGGLAVVTAISNEYLHFGSTEDREMHVPALAAASMWVRPLFEAVLVTLVTWELLPPAWRADRRSRLAFRLAVVGIVLVMAARLTSAWDARVGTNPLTVTATIPHIVLRSADEIGTWLVAIVGTVGVGLLGRHWLHDRRPAGDPLDGWLFMGAGAAWLAIIPSSLDLVDWTLSGRDVVSALLADRMVRISSLVGSWTRCQTGVPYMLAIAASVSSTSPGR